MARTLESRIKKLDKMLRASLIKQSLYDEVFEHILYSLNTIKAIQKNDREGFEEQNKTLEKKHTDQKAVRQLYAEQAVINQQLRKELDHFHANDGPIAQLLDRADAIMQKIDDLYADPFTSGQPDTEQTFATQYAANNDTFTSATVHSAKTIIS